MADATIKIRGGAGNAVQIQSRNIDATAPSDGQALAWSSSDSEWEPTTVGGGGSSEWTDTGSVLHPTESTVDNVVVGGTTTANSDIVLGVDGAAVFNEQSASVDFRIESNGNDHMLLVDGSSDRLGVAIQTPPNTFSVCPVFYSTGTASQSGTTVTGSGTTWTAAMIGSEFVYADGTSSGVITARASNTSISVKTSQTVSSQAYKIHYQGFHVKSDGTVGIGTKDPEYALDLHGHVGGSYQITPRYIRFGAENDPDDISGGLIFKSAYTGYSKIAAKMIGICEGNYGRTGLAWHTGDDEDTSTNAPERMRLSKEGNLGVAVTDPTEKLQVDGVFALKEQSSAPSATADYSKLYSREFGNDANTVLLLHMDGSNGGTTFTDSSAGGATHSFAAVGNANTDTGTKKFGTASAEFDGTGDSVHLSTQHSDFDVGTGDFTLDFWVNFSATTASQYLFEIGTYTTGFSLLWSNSHYLVAYVANATKVIDGSEAGNDWDPTPGTWYHVACQRRALPGSAYATLTIWIDGNELVSVTSTAAKASISSATHGVSVGSEAATPGGTCVNGFMDEVRFSNIARYQESFNAPGAAYPLTGLFTKDSAGTERQLDV